MEIFCTTNLITLLFVKKSNLFNKKQLLQLLVQFKVPPKKKLWLRKLCCMNKIINICIPKYFTDLIPKRGILEMEISLLTVELKVLKIHFSHILLKVH